MSEKYVFERRLGGGGMAEVFLARTVGAEGFSRPVAIKRVLGGLSNNPQFAQMFVAEAQLTARLRHPNIVSIIDFDRDSDGLFLVLELVEGTDLDGLLATGPLPCSLVIFLAIEILRGLDYAHELPISADGVRGVVHRDISPHNVLLSWEGAVKISDFGIAKSRAASNATASVLVKGKPAYMSPEQARGQPLDGRSDLFSVGVMLFEMLCLRPLFAGTTIEETISRLLVAPIPKPHDLRPELPRDLSRVVESLLVRDRDQRVPTANQAIAALLSCADHPRGGREELVATLSQRFAGRAPVRPRDVAHRSHLDPTLVARPAVSALGTPVTVTAGSERWPVPKRRRRWLWAVLASVLVIGGALGLVVASEGPGEPASRVEPPAAEAPSAAPPAPNAPAPVPPAGANTAGMGSAQPPVVNVGEGSGATLPREQAPPSRAPARRTQGPAPKAGIREISL